MSAKALIGALTAAGVLAVAPQVRAQDTGLPGLAAVITEGVGQALGEAVQGGSSVFVTAAGRIRLPTPLAGSYFVNVTGKAESASEAARLREQRMADARRIAGQFGVEMEVGDSAFTREIDQEAEQAESQRIAAEFQAQIRAHPGEPLPPRPIHTPKKGFVARTGVRFRAPDASRLPAFLDALTAAGIEIDAAGFAVQPPNFLTNTQEVLGFGSVEKIDPSIWDQASQAAVQSARRQAEVLAAAAGRRVGEARQIMMLSRSVSGGEASVSIAVRFAYAP